MNSDSKNRRLTDKSNTKTIKTDYLFAIVSEPDNETEYYTGYVLMLKREEKLKGNDKAKSFNDLDNINNDKGYNGVIRIKFFYNGTILEIVGQKDINELYYNEINDTISCLIPRIINESKSDRSDRRNLDEVDGINHYSNETDTKENKTSYLNNIKGRLSLNDSALLNSEYKADINITIEKGNYKQMTFNKELVIQNGEYEKSVDPSLNKTYMGDDINDDITVNGLIQKVETISNQTLNFERDGGEELALKYKDKLEKFDFSDNKLSSTKLRVLSNEEYEENLKLQNEFGNNLNNLRDLADLGDVTQSLYFPLIFNYEIFKMNVLGLQMALRARIEWVPSAGYIVNKISFQRGNKNFELSDAKIEIKNYSNVIKSHKTIMNTIISFLKKQILGKVQENYDQLLTLLKKHLNDYLSNLKNIVNPISESFEKHFNQSFVEFHKKVKEKARNDYTNLYNDLNIFSTL
jgi:hypothetical protein